MHSFFGYHINLLQNGCSQTVFEVNPRVNPIYKRDYLVFIGQNHGSYIRYALYSHWGTGKVANPSQFLGCMLSSNPNPLPPWRKRVRGRGGFCSVCNNNNIGYLQLLSPSALCISLFQCCQIAKFDPFLSLSVPPHTLHPGAIQGKEGIKFCYLATLEEGDTYRGKGKAVVSTRYYCYCRQNRTPSPSHSLLPRRRGIWVGEHATQEL